MFLRAENKAVAQKRRRQSFKATAAFIQLFLQHKQKTAAQKNYCFRISSKYYDEIMSLKNNITAYLKEITTKWKQLQNEPNIFSYKLNISQRKHLPGEHKIYVEVRTKEMDSYVLGGTNFYLCYS